MLHAALSFVAGIIVACATYAATYQMYFAPANARKRALQGMLGAARLDDGTAGRAEIEVCYNGTKKDFRARIAETMRVGETIHALYCSFDLYGLAAFRRIEIVDSEQRTQVGITHTGKAGEVVRYRNLDGASVLVFYGGRQALRYSN